MQENYELVQRGFRILVGSLSAYIGQTLNRLYRDKWWDKVCLALNDQRDLPDYGEYGELVDSLDIANCIRIIDRMWKPILPLKAKMPEDSPGIRKVRARAWTILTGCRKKRLKKSYGCCSMKSRRYE